MDHICLRIERQIATITLQRAEKRNALNREMLSQLVDVCRQIEENQHVHVAIITGSGNSFSAGGDIQQWSADSAQQFSRYWVREGHRVFDALAQLSQPLIAVLNGHALGGGLELAATADLRIAEEHITIGQPETSLGIIPGWSGTQRAVRRFGAQTVRRMALFGEIFSAQQALQHGIVDDIASTGKGLALAIQKAQEVLKRSALANEVTKQLINAAEGEETSRVLDSLAGGYVAGSQQLQENLQSFHNRKKQ